MGVLESVGLDYYDRFEWLLRTTMRAANDNLIVERRRASQVIEEFFATFVTVFGKLYVLKKIKKVRKIGQNETFQEEKYND